MVVLQLFCGNWKVLRNFLVAVEWYDLIKSEARRDSSALRSSSLLLVCLSSHQVSCVVMQVLPWGAACQKGIRHISMFKVPIEGFFFVSLVSPIVLISCLSCCFLCRSYSCSVHYIRSCLFILSDYSKQDKYKNDDIESTVCYIIPNTLRHNGALQSQSALTTPTLYLQQNINEKLEMSNNPKKWQSDLTWTVLKKRDEVISANKKFKLV